MQPLVYMLYHTYEKASGFEESKLIGAYSSEEKAEEALQQVRSKAGFRDYPDGFLITPMRLDQTGWVDGFSSMPDVDENGREI
jgi:hypothetical protein